MIFDRLKGKAKWDEDADEYASNRPNKKKNQQRREGSLVATTDRNGGQKPAMGTQNHFEKLLEGPCLNHAFPIEHLYKDCVLMKQFPRCFRAGGRPAAGPPATRHSLWSTVLRLSS